VQSDSYDPSIAEPPKYIINCSSLDFTALETANERTAKR
jgi:hypothetical protein